MTAALYRALTTLAGPLIALYLRRRLARGKEDPARFAERLGHPGRARPEGPLVWLHGASVGESLSALPLIERLLAERDDLAMLVTTGTVTSAKVMAERLPKGAFHQYVPVDRPDAVARFLAHWRPDLALWVESEFWPNLVLGAQARGVAMALINGRLSARSQRRWRRLPGLIREMLAGFSLCLGQSEAEAERLATLGARDAHCVGNLKYAAAPLPVDEDALATLRAATGNRPCWLAASTHPGEEELVGRAHLALKARWPDLLTVIAPRHPGRNREIFDTLSGLGLTIARRSAIETITSATNVYLADTMGELGLLYRATDIAFIGGSLVPHGGQNPLEAARLNCALLYGPHMHNFAQAVAELEAAGGGATVADATALPEAVAALLAAPEERRRRAAAARQVAAHGGDVLARVLAEIAPLLPARREAEARARA
jgi:3-deoxy-D-manno-octulosonic-acid transferase